MQNALGGKIFAMAYQIGDLQFFPGFFNRFRRLLFHKILQNQFQDKSILFSDCEALQCDCNKTAEQLVLSFRNPTSDKRSHLKFTFWGMQNADVEILRNDGKWEPRTLKASENAHWELDESIAPLDAIILRQRIER